ncbi:MAG: hypothetical protein U0031_22870 [Thermomicrobiales bacterium]
MTADGAREDGTIPPSVADNLRDLGYDIEPAQPGQPVGATIVARRDLGERAILVALDAGGRFRIDLTWSVGEWAADDRLASVPVRVVNTLSRAASIAGVVQRPAQIVGVVAALGELASWAAPAAEGRTEIPSDLPLDIG